MTLRLGATTEIASIRTTRRGFFVSLYSRRRTRVPPSQVEAGTSAQTCHSFRATPV
jgi:hypothetical protein